jgi:hypothetical protein
MISNVMTEHSNYQLENTKAITYIKGVLIITYEDADGTIQTAKFSPESLKGQITII